MTLITPCSECPQTSLVEVNDELVWELGQTCEAARNGIIMHFQIKYLINSDFILFFSDFIIDFSAFIVIIYLG